VGFGEPFGSVLTNDNPTIDLGAGFGSGATYHPMKGPMLTQSLRGLLNTGPLHWRGDRSGATAGGSAFDAEANLRTFDVAFTALLGPRRTCSTTQTWTRSRPSS
jgi:hypothetical protein